MRISFLIASLLLCFRTIAQNSSSCDLKIGTNLLGINYAQANTEQPFVDLMKMALNWRTQNNNSTTPFNTNVIDSIPKDENGYPLYLPVSVNGQSLPQVVATTFCNGIDGKYPTGTYTFIYEGTGTFSFGGDAVVSSANVNEIKLNVNTTSNAGITLKILTSDINNPVKNIRLIMPNHETTYQTQPFNPAFLNKIEPFGTLRFMDWMYTNNNDNIKWENRRKPGYYTQATYGAVMPRLGIAYEYIIQLANLTQKDIWINVPYMADSNYIAQMAQFFKDNLDPNIKIYLEYSNEVWNPVFYSQSVWVSANAPSNLINTPQKTAYFAKRVFDIWYQVYGNEASLKLIRVAGTQMGNPWVGQQMLAYLTSSGVDAVAPAAYIDFRSSHYDSLDVYGSNTKVSDVIRLTRKSFNELKPLYIQNSATAINYNVREIYYEGGQHLIPEGGIQQPYGQALLDAQTDTAMYNVYQELMEFIRDSTQSDLLMHFTLTSRKSTTIGAFGCLESIYETSSQKYQSLIDFIDACDVVLDENTPAGSSEISVFPNPNNGHFYLQTPNGKEYHTMQIYSCTGIKIYDGPFKQEVEIPYLEKGIYYINLLNSKEKVSSRIVKIQ